MTSKIGSRQFEPGNATLTDERLRAFLDTGVLIDILRGRKEIERLFSPEVERRARYVVNTVVIQELVLSSSVVTLPDYDELTKHVEVVESNIFSDPDAHQYVNRLRRWLPHPNDRMILESARRCDILLTDDKTLLDLGDAAEVAMTTPEEFLAGLGVGR